MRTDALLLPWSDDAPSLPLITDGPGACPLPDWAVIRVTGADAGNFLQGQSTGEVLGLVAGVMGCGAFCTPKGRVIANFRLARIEDAFYLLLAADLAAAVQQRLQRYVLRSKVVIECLERTLLGVWGAGSGPALDGLGLGRAGAERFRLAETGECHWLAIGPDARLDGLLPICQPLHPDAWRWRDLDAGFPLVGAACSEAFLPQMLNLDLLGGVSFKKGCYTGQEIVTRTHFLGQLKRRLFRLHGVGGDMPAPGCTVLDTRQDESRTAGQIVNACRNPQGGWDVLAVLALELADSPQLRAMTPDGPLLAMGALPYAITDPA